MQVANYIQGVVQLCDMSQTFNIHSIIKTQFYQRRKTIRVITVWGGGGGGGGGGGSLLPQEFWQF